MPLKSFLSFIKIATIVASSSLAIAAGSAIAYDVFTNEKTPSSEQFDFDANTIGDNIVLDGQKDSVYGSPVLSFGTKVSGQYDIDLYTHHGNQALYLYFDVYDEYVTKRAIGDNNAQDEDGVEISIDTLLNGGTAPQTDDLRIYLGVTGFTRVLKGNGTGWDSTAIGFGGQVKTRLKPGTTANDNSDIDTGYCIEYRIPYISIFGEATKETPLAFAFVHSELKEVTGSRTRTGMSGHPDFKIPTADTPGAFPVLTSEERFYTRTDYNNLNENMPMVVGRVYDRNNNPMPNISISGYYSRNSLKIYNRTTDSDGYFSFEDIKTDDDFIVTAKKSGYLPYSLTYSSKNLINANGAEYYQKFVLISASTTTRTVTGQISALDGEVLSGFNVSLLGFEGVSTTTDASGNFSIDVYNDIDNAVSITKSGYETMVKEVGNGVNSIPTFEMFHTVTNLIKPSNKTLLFNYADAGVVRGKDALYVRASTPYIISGYERLSIYLDADDKSGFSSLFSNGDYRVDLEENKISLSRYSDESGEFVHLDDASALLKYETKLEVLYETTITIPYQAFDFDKADVFGAACEFYNGSELQDSYTNKDIAKDGEIDASYTATYLRFAANNKVYFSNNNTDTDFLYYYHGVDGATSEDIPNNADRVYMDYDRDDNGITMRVTVSNGFGNHFNTSTGLAGAEAINILMNLDGVNGTAWALYKNGSVCYDINLRIYGDDTICFINSNDVRGQSANQMWWSDYAHNNGVAKNFTLNSKTLDQSKYEIDTTSGCKTYVLNLSYADLLAYGEAPSGTTLNRSSSISTCLFEVSETSKTTVRFYTSSGDAWLFKNKQLSTTLGAFSTQANYVNLPANK